MEKTKNEGRIKAVSLVVFVALIFFVSAMNVCAQNIGEDSQKLSFSMAVLGTLIGIIFFIIIFYFSYKSTAKGFVIGKLSSCGGLSNLIEKYSAEPKCGEAGELNPAIFDEELTNMMYEKGQEYKILIDKYLCIGKEENEKFMPSQWLIYILQMGELRRKKDSNTKFDKESGIVMHGSKGNPVTHYIITTGFVLYHKHEGKERTGWYIVPFSSEIKKFEKKFSDDFENRDVIYKPVLKKELEEAKENSKEEIYFLTYVGGKYRYAKNEEIEDLLKYLNN
ncbi:MAG: hypothetical protein CVT89_03880 [Candidatus Altiarchaeales archaeon HGW-Altiarchaeales-2]|nr:MAG: hypothetical protein CVT89_03880 [Candidatus Altiarchaeales archaeon HGW-Altiarchaeales-2]